jgi:hypothetical protein
MITTRGNFVAVCANAEKAAAESKAAIAQSKRVRRCIAESPANECLSDHGTPWGGVIPAANDRFWRRFQIRWVAA